MDQKCLHAFPKRHLVRKVCVNVLDFLRRTHRYLVPHGGQGAMKSQMLNSVTEPQKTIFLDFPGGQPQGHPMSFLSVSTFPDQVWPGGPFELSLESGRSGIIAHVWQRVPGFCP